MSNKINIAAGSLSNESETGFCQMHQYSIVTLDSGSKTDTPKAIGEWLVQLQEVVHARISQSPDNAPESEESEIWCRPSSIPCALYDRERCCLRTSQGSFQFEQCETDLSLENYTSPNSSERLPKFGTIVDGALFPLPMLEQTICGNGSGLWRTPCSRDHHPSKIDGNNTRTDMQVQLAHQVKMLPTPRANKTTNENPETWLKRNKDGKVSTPPLETAVRMNWPTPKATASHGPGIHGQGGMDLQTAVTFPTPSASMMTEQDMEQARYSGNDPRRPKYKDAKMVPTPSASAAIQGQNEPDGKRGQTLVGAARKQTWGSPRANDHKETGDLSNTPVNGFLGRQVKQPKNPFEKEYWQMVANALLPSPEPDPLLFTKGSLNPDWVDWLMNFPIGWTSTEPLDMDEFQRWKENYMNWWAVDPADCGAVPRLATGVKDRVNRLKAAGNAWVPLQGVVALRILSGR